MEAADLEGRLAFIQAAEQLKNVLRSAYTSNGSQESTAEHTWRLCLLAMTFADQVPGVNVERVLKLCIIHDLGEAIGGDIPAVLQAQVPDKAERERCDLIELMRPLPAALQEEFLGLWEEYEAASTREARLVKGLDKLETIIQHNQGANPPGFDYAYNLEYGSRHTSTEPVLSALRSLVDADTRRRMG